MRSVRGRGRNAAMVVPGVGADSPDGSVGSVERPAMGHRRLIGVVLTWLCALMGALALSSAPALAAAPETPETGKATALTATTATLTGGVLNPNASGEPGEYEYLYRVSETECEGEDVAPEPSGIAVGFEKEPVSPVELTGLQPNAKYTFCLIEHNAVGEASPTSTPGHFTTLPAAPSVEAETTSGVKSTEAVLEAQVNPNNQETTYSFEYSTQATGEVLNGTVVRLNGASALAGFGDQTVSVPVSALEAGTTYYYRVLAENEQSIKEGNPVRGAVESFTTVPTPSTDPVGAVTSTTATLNGHLTLDTVDTQYSFDYNTGGECTGGSTTSTTDAGSGPGTVVSEATPVTGLLSHTRYTVCLVTSNAFGSEVGAPVSFETPAGAPTISSESVSEVTATSARLQAQIDPHGADTTYHFDYGTTVAYGQSTPESSSIGADNSEHSISTEIQGLQPGVTYHYRLVATNSQSLLGGTPGPDQTFTTEAAGGGFTLPDGRQYELVSPPQKDGAEILGIGGGGRTAAGGDATQASEDGTSVTYIANAPIGATPSGNTWSTQIFSTRGPGGWASQDISPAHKNAVGIGNAIEVGEEYQRFSPDLSRAILMSPHQEPEPPLAPEIHQEVAGAEGTHGAPYGQEIYLRNDLTGVFQAVQTKEPLPEIAFEGASPDLSHVVFEGPAGFDPKYPAAGGLYEWMDGHVQLISLLPGGEPVSGQSLLGRDFLNSFGLVRLSATMHAVSDDGSRVVWGTEGNLFTRDIVSSVTTAIGSGAFQTASNDGSRVFYTNGDLFMFDVADGTHTDLGGSGTVFGANEEGTMVYETSSDVLTGVANEQGEKARTGANNLYLLREMPVGSDSWHTTFVTAGLEEGSSEKVASDAPLARQTVGISPDGRYLAFMSDQSLTGYDNRDANSGEPDEEVYLYDAESNRLVCASCNPSGARPVGEDEPMEPVFGLPIDPFMVWKGHWLAATIPGWTPDGGSSTTGYQPRFLSDSGRLFFDGTDALTPQDVNGRDDVYQYEPSGIGGCQPPTYGQSGSDVFSVGAGGCVGLISAGTGGDDSTFFDASASGSDVFFTTEDGLVSQDKDGTADMYDARICIQTEPCPQSLAVAPPCSTADSCRAAPSPQPGVFAAPASATFAGAGNVASPAATSAAPTTKKKAKAKAEIRAERLAKALKACKRRPKGQRAACAVKARKRYGKVKTSGRRVK
jgi:hypothetical protein